MIKEKDGFKYSTKEFEGYKYRAKYVVVNDSDGEQLYNMDVYTDCEDKKTVLLTLFYATKKKHSQPFTAEIINFCSKEQDDLNTKFIEETLKDI